MAEVVISNVTMQAFGGRLQGRKWGGIAQGDTAAAIPIPSLADKTIQVVGTFGGGSISIQGALESDLATAVFTELTNPQGDALSYSAAGIDTVLQNVYWIKPVLTGGDGTTDIDVYLLSKGGQ